MAIITRASQVKLMQPYKLVINTNNFRLSTKSGSNSLESVVVGNEQVVIGSKNIVTVPVYGYRWRVWDGPRVNKSSNHITSASDIFCITEPLKFNERSTPENEAFFRVQMSVFGMSKEFQGVIFTDIDNPGDPFKEFNLVEVEDD